MKIQFRQFCLKIQSFFAWICVLFLGTVPAYAQQAMFTNQQHFGVEEGLPQSYISGITQDKDGFLWLATLDGLARYDGRRFRTFRYNPGDSTGLAGNAIYYVYPQVNNQFSLSYDGLLNDEFDLQSFKVTHNSGREKLRQLAGEIWKVSYSQYAYNGKDWIFICPGNQGIGILNVASEQARYCNKKNGALQQDSISAIVLTDSGKLYMLSPGGIQVSDVTLKKYKFIPIPGLRKLNVQTKAGRQTYSSLAVLPNNRLAYFDLNTIVIFDLTRQTFVEHPIPAGRTPKPVYERSTKVDSKGRLYFETEGRVIRMEANGEMKLLWENVANPSLHISAYFIDWSDVLWVSVNAQGLTKVDLQALPFSTYKYKVNFISDIMEQAGARKQDFPGHWSLLEMSYYFRQATDGKGNRYVCHNYGNRNEVFVLNASGLKSFRHVPSNALYTALIVMPDGEVRVYDEKTAAWYCWTNPDAIPTIIQFDKQSMVDMNLADARMIGGYLWLSTYTEGLLQYKDTTRVNHFSGTMPTGKMPNDLTEICPDPTHADRFWVGSRGGGLVLWNVKSGLEKIYTTNDGLPNNTIYCILPGKNGTIWCSSNKGIFRFDPATKQVTSFEKPDGLQGNEFNRAHKLLFNDGRIAFGGMEGYTIFHPDDFEIKATKVEVPVMVTALQINNRPQGMGIPNGYITQPVATIKELDLPYDQNYLRFEFAALLFNQPQKTRYRYQLKGADDDWIDNGTSNVAAYAAIKPGDYVLQLNATDQNGQWSNTIKEINILIRPPFWATWWARLSYVLLAAGLLLIYLRFREKAMRTKQQLVFEQREALRLKEMDEVKDRFFSNITHEFRTPLTLIVTPLEKLAQNTSLPAPVLNTVNIAQKNSRQLLSLINEFLDFSKLQDGQMQLKFSAGELTLFVKEIMQSFEATAQERNVELSFVPGSVSGSCLFDQEKWAKILTNLLGNALKFTPAGGKVTVTLNLDENEVAELQVTDTGLGIDPAFHTKVFDRFYQVDDSSIRTAPGTGIGLALVKELTTLMKGKIRLESKIGGPTSFTVSIPVQRAPGSSTMKTVMPLVSTDELAGDAVLPLVLVVEDNEDLRSFLVDSLSEKFRVIAASDGLIAWEQILTELPEVVISDVMMPGQDGFDLCRQCKADPRTAHIAFILLTSRAAHEARLKGLGTGADDYVTKPFHLDELILRTSNLLQLQGNMRAYLQTQLLSEKPAVEVPVATDPFLQKLYAELESRIDDPSMGVESLCQVLGMSRSTLNRKMKSLLDISANDLIRTYRLQKATGMLVKGMDISGVAYKVGFSSPSYFTQCFREQYGLTPTEFVANNNPAH
ncbi:MAG: ATP-binding protein [Ferruginibacter sp.]|nr:ATP-binding protein [Ferruginibacter sp.]